MNDLLLEAFVKNAIKEDIGNGDHTSLACIPPDHRGKAKLLVKQPGIIAGIDIAQYILKYFDASFTFELLKKDGDYCINGDIAFYTEGPSLLLLQAERLVLNVMQRMSGIATTTQRYVKELEGLKTKVLDTRKTTPGFRFIEKEAVRIGGGVNHRFGLYDMILIKDNHIDFSGGIRQAIEKVNSYLSKNAKNLKIEVEVRTFEDIRIVLETGKVHRIMLDNFSVSDTREAVKMIAGKFETESSGGITIENLRQYGECGVDFISVGALTHQINSLDLSLKAIK
jgi:nicotinate-nucleotide pyrophosphorylase (carboxylating)